VSVTENRVSNVTEERTRLAGTVDELTCVLTGQGKENHILNEMIKELADSLSDSNNEAGGLRLQT